MYEDTMTHPWEETSLIYMYKHLSTTMDNRQEAYQLLTNEIQNMHVQIQSQQQQFEAQSQTQQERESALHTDLDNALN